MRSTTLADLPPPLHGRSGWPWTVEVAQLSKTMPDGSPCPQLSIVTPSYNQGQYIEETVRSVLLQGYPNLEYLIIDGGSTDESVEIIRKYEPWLAYWVSEPDDGQSAAVNKGWRQATGRIVAYLNSDDVLEPGALQKVAEAFRARPETALVYGDCNVINGAGQVIEHKVSRPYQRASLLLGNYIHQSSAFVGRHAFEQVGLLDESLHMSMDYDYWVRLAMAGFDMTYVPIVLSSARLTPDTKTASLALRYLPDTLGILDSVYRKPEVPSDVRRVERKAYANAWRLGGVRYFDAGLRRQTIQAMLKSLCRNPLPGWRPLAVTVALMLQAVLGLRWRSAYTVEKAGSTY